MKDAGTINPEMISFVKRNNCGEALKHSRIVLDILGGNACSDEYVLDFCYSAPTLVSTCNLTLLTSRYHVGRHVANLQVTNTYEGM